MEQKKRIISISASVFIVLAVAVISIFLLGDEESVKLKKDTMQIEAGEEMEFHLSDYVEGSKEQMKEVKADTSDVDTDKPGDYKISIAYKDREFLIRVSVKDTTPPIIQVSGEAVVVMAGESVSVDELGIKVDDFSECGLTFSDGEKTKTFEAAGEVNEKIIAIDAYENTSQAEVSFQVLVVNVPEIYGEGLRNRTFYIEDGIDLLAGVAAQDAEDGDLTGQIQVDAPDMTTPGKKEITYRVTDSDGHETVRSIRLTAESRIEVLDKVMYAAGEAAVRRSASESAQQFGTLQYNEAVDVTGQDKVNGWYRIVYNGEEGYVIGTALGDNEPVSTEMQDNFFPNEGSDGNALDDTESQGGTQYLQIIPMP